LTTKRAIRANPKEVDREANDHLCRVFVLGLAAHPSGVSQPVYTTIDVPGATATSASRINSRGQIVGGYLDANGNGHGFLIDEGVSTTIDVPGANGTGAVQADDPEAGCGTSSRTPISLTR
jgi:hypothetical protein